MCLVALGNLATDQRLHKMAKSLQELGGLPMLVGFKLGSGPMPERPYPTAHLPLWAQRGPLLYLEANLRLYWHLLWLQTDVVTANDIDILPAAWLAARLRRSRLVLDCHELFTELASLQHRPLARRMWQWVERLLLPCTDALITVNSFLADYFKRLYNADAHVVYNYPAAANPYPSSTEKRFAQKIMLYQGSLQADRGLELMCDAMPLLPGFTLWIVGGGPLASTLHIKYGNQPNIKLWGEVPMQGLPAITAQASFGLSLEPGNGLNQQYATPNKVYDYLAAGLPVVVNNLPGLRSQIAPYHAGIVLEDYTPLGLVQIIMPLFADYDAYSKLSAGAHRAAQQCQWQQQHHTIAAAYALALRKKD